MNDEGLGTGQHGRGWNPYPTRVVRLPPQKICATAFRRGGPYVVARVTVTTNFHHSFSHFLCDFITNLADRADFLK